MVSRSYPAAVRTRARLFVALRFVLGFSAICFALYAHAQDFCPASYVPRAFTCGYGNAALNGNTNPCYGPSIDAIEGGIRAYNNPSYYISYSPPTLAPDTWSNWYPATYYGNQAGITGTYLAIFVDISNPHGTDQEAYGIGAAGCTQASYFVAVPPHPAPSVADYGNPPCHCAAKNGHDPVTPSSGNEFLEETDIPSIGSQHPLSFKRYYNSLDTTSRDQGPAWWHSFSRHLAFGMSYPATQPPSSEDSALYLTPAEACTSGWPQIQSHAQGLQTATASYAGGVCSLSLNGSIVMTLPVYDNRGQYITVDSAISSVAVVNAYRDDGHVVGFSASGSEFTAEPGAGYQLVTTASGGYQIIDDHDNVCTSTVFPRQSRVCGTGLSSRWQRL